jgi:hypothetical protein
MSDSSFEELLKSPYSDREPDDSDAIPWKPPVAAAIGGALVMATFLIYSIATAPDDPTAATTTTNVATEAIAVQATGFPPGYVAVSDDVAMRADVMRTDSNSTTFFVSSVTESGTDPESASAVDVVSWRVRSNGSEPSLLYQHSSRTALGGVTVDLSPVSDPLNAVLVATLPGTFEDVEDVLTLVPEVPTVVTDHRIAVGDAVVVVDELAIGNGYGSMRWHLEGGLAARVDVRVVFDGVQFPLVLLTPYNDDPDFARGFGDIPPAWNPQGEITLLRDGEPLSDVNVPTGITVTFAVSVVSEAGEEIEFSIGETIQD